jgi:hypothetical protein
VTTIGIISGGDVRSNPARAAIDHGCMVVLSNSPGQAPLAGLFRDLRPGARPATPADAARAANFATVPIRVATISQVPAEPLAGKAVLDGDGHPAGPGTPGARAGAWRRGRRPAGHQPYEEMHRLGGCWLARGQASGRIPASPASSPARGPLSSPAASQMPGGDPDQARIRPDTEPAEREGDDEGTSVNRR